MTRTLEAHNLTISKVLGGDYEFEIPRYQRPYAWTTDNTVQLLEDLEEARGRADDEPYFLGSIVLVRKPTGTVEVIDGQQRLTTLTILLAVLRDLTESDGLRDGVQRCIAYNARPWQPQALPTHRLSVRPKDREFFREHVQSVGATAGLASLTDNAVGTDPRKAVRDNAAALRTRLSARTDAERTALFEFLHDRTELVVVSTADPASAHRIFSVMNARGLPLSPTDIFKSSVIGELADDQEDRYADKWDQYENLLGRDAFTDLFRDIRTVETRKRAEKELLHEFPKQVLHRYLAASNETGFIDDLLRPYAEAFDRTRRRDFGPGVAWQRVNVWLERLSRLDNTDWRPPALWALTNHPDDPDTLSTFLSKLDRLAASSMLRNEYTTPRVTRYVQLLEQLHAGQGVDSGAFDLTDPEKQAARAALSGEIYWMRPARRKLVMLRLEDVLARDSGVTFDHKLISVEHVLPQSPKDDSQWRRDFTDDDRERWTHRLGNLVLLNRVRNSEANNKEFAAKKKTYFQTRDGGTNFTLTSQVINEDEWTPAVVERRQAALEKLLVAEWDLA